MLHHCRVHTTVLPGVHVTHTASARAFPRHWHGTYGIGVVDDGAQRSASGRGPVEAHAGAVITHNPGEVHDGRPVGDHGRAWRMLHVEPAALAALLGEPSPARCEWHEPVSAAPDRVRPLRHALALAASTDADALQRFEEALLLAVGWIHPAPSPRWPADGAAPAAWSAVLDRLRDDLATRPTLDELSQLAGLDRYALVRQFGRRHGLPPIAWWQQWRLERSRLRIASGESLADVAAACGFSDQSHLTRQFLRQFGHTPGAWQRAVMPLAARPTARSAAGPSRARTF